MRWTARPRVDKASHPEPPDGPTPGSMEGKRSRDSRQEGRPWKGPRHSLPHSCTPLPAPQHRLARIPPQTPLGARRFHASWGTRAGGRAAAAAVGDVDTVCKQQHPRPTGSAAPRWTSGFGEGFEATLSTASWNPGAGVGRGVMSATARPWESAVAGKQQPGDALALPGPCLDPEQRRGHHWEQGPAHKMGKRSRTVWENLIPLGNIPEP